MLELFVLFLMAVLLAGVFVLIARMMGRFNKNRPFRVEAVSFAQKKDRQLIDGPLILILFPSAIQAILLSHVPFSEEVTWHSPIFYSIATFLLLNMVAYLLIIKKRKMGRPH